MPEENAGFDNIWQYIPQFSWKQFVLTAMTGKHIFLYDVMLHIICIDAPFGKLCASHVTQYRKWPFNPTNFYAQIPPQYSN